MIRRDLFWWGAVCALGMLCASAHGQSCDTSGWQRAKLAETQVHPAMVKLTVADGRGGQSHGSGVIIDKHEDRAYVLTCWHLFRDGARAVYVCIPQLGCAPGRVEAVSQLWDAAIVSIPSSPRLQFVRTAEASPRVGDVVFVGGYGSGQWRWQAGRVRQYLSPGGGAAFDMIEVSAASREGDSGGPMLDEPGRVCGVLCGNGGRSAAGTGIARLRAIFADVVPAWRASAPPNVTEGGPLEPIDLPATDPPAPPGGTPEPSTPPTANAPAPSTPAAEPVAAEPAPRPTATSPPGRPAKPAAPKGPVSTPAVRDVVVGIANPWIDRALAAGIGVLATFLGLQIPGVRAIVLARLVRGGARIAIEHRRQREAADPPQIEKVIIRHDNPPPPPIVDRSREFVEVVVPDQRLKALQWAMDEYVRRFPGARPFVDTVESYASQYLSGNPKPKE